MKHNLIKLSLLTCALATLTACAGHAPTIMSSVQDDKEAAGRAAGFAATTPLAEGIDANVRGGALDAERRAKAQLSPAVLRQALLPWLGGDTVAVGLNERLPTVFSEPVTLNFDDASTNGRVPLTVVAARITKVTGVPIRVKSDVFQDDAGASATRVMATPIATPLAGAGAQGVPQLPSLDGLPGASRTAARGAAGVMTAQAPAEQSQVSVNALEMRWKGTLEGFLERVTDRLGLSWEFRDGVVVIEKFRTETFEIALADSESSYSMGLNASDQSNTGGSGSGSSAQSTAATEVTEKGKSNLAAGILKGVQHIIATSSGSSVVQSEGTGRLIVTTTKDKMGQVREFVNSENAALLRQAQIQFDIYSIKSSDNLERGVDWSAVYKALNGTYGINFTGPSSLVSASAGALNFQILNSGTSDAARRLGDSSAMVKLLSSFGTTVQHKPISLLTLNRSWVRKAMLNNKVYVSETTPGSSTLGGAATPGLKTNTVTYGDRYLAMPQILDNNTVLLKFSLGLSSLIDLPQFSSGSGSNVQTVQTPETSGVNDQSTIRLRPGETLAITGMSRLVSKSNRNSLTEQTPVIFGGGQRVEREREDFLILVRSTIL